MRPESTRLLFVMAVLAAGLAIACSSPERELRRAKEAGTIEALEAFLAQHPDGPLAQEAKDAKEQLVFRGIKTTNTVAAYEDFLKRYPNGKLVGSARAGIEELHFKDAAALGTIEAYESFLRQHPQGANASPAGQALDNLLPAAPWVASVVATSTEPALCSVFTTVTLVQKSTSPKLDAAPAVTPGMMNCAGTIGATGIEVVMFAAVDSRHTTLQLKSFSKAGWGECRGGASCTVRFSLMGQEQVVTAVYR
jgi:hypothetical protein